MALAALAAALAAATAAVLINAVLRSPVDPVPLPLPSLTPPHFPPSNNLLQQVEKLGEGVVAKPEDVLVDSDGVLYTASRDGWVHRMHPNGSWEQWRPVGGPSLLGIAFSSSGDLLVCDADKGLVSVGAKDGVVKLLASEAGGRKLLLADEVVEAKDGTVYFTDASDKFGLHEHHLDLLEARPNGRLLAYDPRTGAVTVVLDGLGFANGVALSQDGDFLVYCESTRFRCTKLWLEGEGRGRTEILIDNLPGGPDNIHLAPDGAFWIALISVKNRLFRWIAGWPAAKKVVAAIPALLSRAAAVPCGAMVIKVSPEGEVVRMLDDDDGKVMSFVTSAVEFDGHVYFGSLVNNFIGKLPLTEIDKFE